MQLWKKESLNGKEEENKNEFAENLLDYEDDVAPIEDEKKMKESLEEEFYFDNGDIQKSSDIEASLEAEIEKFRKQSQ